MYGCRALREIRYLGRVAMASAAGSAIMASGYVVVGVLRWWILWLNRATEDRQTRDDRLRSLRSEQADLVRPVGIRDDRGVAGMSCLNVSARVADKY